MKTIFYYLDLLEPFGIARSTYSKSETFIVNLDGGWGEGIPSRFFGEDENEVAAKFEEIEKLEFPDPDSIDASLELLTGRTHPQMCAKAAIDIALHDRLCKKRGIPVSRLFGASAGKKMITSYTIGIDTPENMLRKVEASSKFDILKIKLGRNMENDISIMKLIRKALPGKCLRVDANCGWSPSEARIAAGALANLGVEYIEQPLARNQPEEMRALREVCPLPLYADEDIVTSEDIHRFDGAVDGINIKLMKCGGLAEAFRMIQVARSYGMKIMIGGRIESSIAVTAAAHLGPLVDSYDLDANILVSNDPFCGVLCDERGHLELPAGSGLGVTVRPEYASIFEECANV